MPSTLGSKGKEEGGNRGEVERLHAKFHLNVFIVSDFGSKNHNVGQLLTFGVSYTYPLLPMRAKFAALEQPKVYTYTPNFICMCLLCRLPMAKNHNFWAYFDIFASCIFSELYAAHFKHAF